jgi:hypothetical protein
MSVGSNFKDNNFKNCKNKIFNCQLKGKNVKTFDISSNTSSNHTVNSSVNISTNTYIHNIIPVHNMFDILYPECEDLIDDVFSDNNADQRDSEVGSQQGEASGRTCLSAVLSARCTQPNLDYDKQYHNKATTHSCKSVESNHDIQIKNASVGCLSFNGNEGQSGGLGAGLRQCSDKWDCVIGLGNQWHSLTTDFDPQYENIDKSVLIERESEYTNLQTAPDHDLDSRLDTNSLGLGLESHLFENVQGEPPTSTAKVTKILMNMTLFR